MWMLLVLVYGLLKGTRDVVKKKSLERNTVIEVLFSYTLISFLLLLPSTGEALAMPTHHFPLILVKAFCVFAAWIVSFYAIEEMPVSLYGVIDMSRVLFAYALGILVLKETLSINQIIGMPLVLLGLLLLKLIKTGRKDHDEKVSPMAVFLALLSCLLNAVSGFIDKYIMTKDITSAQLQYWYMLFMLIFYIICLIAARKPIHYRTLVRNYWIPLLSIMFVIGDRSLFMANADPASKLTVMTLIKQSSCFVTIILGRLMFKERNIFKKSICALVVLAGILTACS